jgi:hypothetical protein
MQHLVQVAFIRVPLPAARTTITGASEAADAGVLWVMVDVLASIFLQFPEGSGTDPCDG